MVDDTKWTKLPLFSYQPKVINSGDARAITFATP